MFEEEEELVLIPFNIGAAVRRMKRSGHAPETCLNPLQYRGSCQTLDELKDSTRAGLNPLQYRGSCQTIRGETEQIARGVLIPFNIGAAVRH